MCQDKISLDHSDVSTEVTTSIADLINSALVEKSLSLRGFCRITGMNPSTLSRIINDKQLPSIRHLQLFTEYLEIPLVHLLQTFGIDTKSIDRLNHEDNVLISMIDMILKTFDIEIDQIVGDIRKELKKYEHYALTTSAMQTIQQEFPIKLKQLNSEGIIINYLERLYQRYCLIDTEPAVRALAGSALIYLLQAPDVIPDYAFPIGYIDDAIAVMLIVRRLLEEHHIDLSS